MIYRACAKVNIFLKIVGIRGDYHEICSRFILVENLFDELSLVPKKTNQEFELIGDFGCDLSYNTIFKAYKALKKAGFKKEVEELFNKKALHVCKHIPSFAGLGGGSSDAATFLRVVNNELNLGLNPKELAKMGLSAGADVPFFVYGYKSANVRGIGEVIEKIDEEPLHVEISTPPIKCDTGKIYRVFRDDYSIDLVLADKMSKMNSYELLETYSDIELNDLLKAALKVDKEIQKYRKQGWFFSGSGSSFFRLKVKKQYG